MLKVYSKKVISSIVASSLVFGLGTAAIHAAPKTDAKETGRTEQNVQTGVISFNDVTVARYAKEIKLTGTVVIDGPQLVVTIPSSKSTTVTKVGDKIWRYEATIDVSNNKGDTEIEIAAHTIYVNGKPAGSIHTSAPKKIQTIHVPYVITTFAKDTVWTAYNRSTNEFNLSYNEVQKWSAGYPVVTAKTMDVKGSESTVTVLGTNIDVPIANRDFVFSAEDPTWKFDANTETYSATFNILITNSKGQTSTESVTKPGLSPGEVNTISHSVTDGFGKITKSQALTAPKFPVVEVVAVKLQDLELDLVRQNDNFFWIKATYTIIYSNGSKINVENEEYKDFIGNPNSNQTPSREYKIGGFNYQVTVSYNSSTKKYHATAVLKN